MIGNNFFIICTAVPFVILCIITAMILVKPFTEKYKKEQITYPVVMLFTAVYGAVINYLYETAEFPHEEIQAMAAKCKELIAAVMMIFIGIVWLIFAYRLITFIYVSKAVKNGKVCADITKADMPPFLAKLLSKDTSSEKRNFIGRLKVVIMPSVLFTYMLFVFGVFEPFFANITEWTFKAGDIVPPMLICCAVSLCLACLGALIFKGRKLDVFAGIIVMVCAASYIQNAFLNKGSVLKGNTFSASLPELAVNNFIWIILLFIPYFVCMKSRNTAVKGSLYLSAALLFIQAVPLPYIFIEGLPLNSRVEEKYFLDGSGQFEVSDKENIMVFFMDSYYSGYLKEYLDENPEYSSVLSDFIFFDNVATEDLSTSASMPCILTGENIDYSISISEACANCWNSEKAEKFYGLLHENGYDIRLYTDSDLYCGGAENMLGKIDNIISYKPIYETNRFAAYAALMKLTLYRYCPYALKNLFIVSDSSEINGYTKDVSVYTVDSFDPLSASESSVSRGIQFYNNDYYQRMIKGFSPTSDNKLCVFQHLMGMHTPFYSTEKKDVLKSDALDACMKILLEYINTIRELDVYDKTTVIFTADHGNDYPNLNKSGPVMLIKPSGRKGNGLVTNTAPGVIQSEFLSTVLYCAGIDCSDLGNSLFDIDENTVRTRIYRRIIFDGSLPPIPKCGSVGTSAVNCIYEYTYTGRTDDTEPEGGNDFTIYPITDYWW